jgi:hypothetical protein
MRKISIYLKPKRIQLSIRKDLVGSIGDRLGQLERFSKMVLVKKGKFIGKLSLNRSHDNAIDLSKKMGYEVFLGYFIWRYPGTSWKYKLHSFCVDSDYVVIEPSSVPEWSTVDSHYIGIPIPKELLVDSKYLTDFNSIDFINQHSPLALFELDYSKEDFIKTPKKLVLRKN